MVRLVVGRTRPLLGGALVGLLALSGLLGVPAAAATAGPVFAPRGLTADGWEEYAGDFAAVLPQALPEASPFQGEISWPQDGRDRRVRVAYPAVDGPAPLVIALHGLYQGPETMLDGDGWALQSALNRFIVVAPVGTSGSWNAGRCCGRAVVEGVDDVAFLDRVVEVVAALHPVDRSRVYLTGFSNGAMMAYRYACERPEKVAALLSVAGGHVSPCRPGTAVPVLEVHGARDGLVPLKGTAYSRALGTRLPSVRDTLALWQHAAVGTDAPVRGVTLASGGHAWPTAGTGFDATGQGWSFLSSVQRPAS